MFSYCCHGRLDTYQNKYFINKYPKVLIERKMINKNTNVKKYILNNASIHSYIKD